MDGQLVAFLEELKNDSTQVSAYDETDTKQAIISPLLKLLGWDTAKPNEVKLEYSVGDGRVDYSLRLNGRDEVFIEAKNAGEDLNKAQYEDQLLHYSYRQGVELAILTNGIIWWFYLPKQKGNWKERKFYIIDITQQDCHGIAQKFRELLSKTNIQTGEALKQAELIYEGRQKKNVLEETLPKAWNKLVSEPDSLLVGLVSETTEKICGFKPEVEDVTKFLKNCNNHPLPSPIVEKKISNKELPKFTNSVPSNVVEKKGKRKTLTYGRMKLQGEVFELYENYGILFNTAEWLIRKGKLKSSDCPVSVSRGERNLVNAEPKHKDGKRFFAPKKLSNGLYVVYRNTCQYV